jgi:hypothetical protein
MKLVRLILAAAVLLFAADPAQAKPEPVLAAGAESAPGGHVSYSTWVIEGPTVRLRVMVSAAEAQALDGPRKPLMTRAAVADAVSQAMTVTSAAGDCPAIDQGEGVGEIYTMALTPGLDRYEIVFVCENPKGMVLHDQFLFKATPAHIDYARIQVGSDQPVLRLFTRSQQSVPVPAAGAPGGPSLQTMVQQGALRLVKRWDALCFLAALLLLSLRWRDLALIAGGLAAGYGASLIATWEGLALTRPPLAGVAIGLLIVAAAAGGLRRQSSEAEPPSRTWRIVGSAAAVILAVAAGVAAVKIGDMSALVASGLALFALVFVWDARASNRPAWLVTVPAFLFALLDGMGPASEVAVLGLPRGPALPALAGFDLGAGGAAVGLIACVMAVLWALGRKLSVARKPAADIGGAALIGLGVFWFVSRLYS